MVEISKRYICDICGDEVTINDNKNIPAWITKTEVGDLCPGCFVLWVKAKKDFIERSVTKVNDEQ